MPPLRSGGTDFQKCGIAPIISPKEKMNSIMKCFMTTIFIILLCSSMNANQWAIEPNNFGGGNRTNAAVFVIGNVAYVGTGYDGSSFHSDLWAFDGNTWTRKTDIPVGRKNAVAFSIGGKGYMGLGDNLSGVLRDIYEFDPAANMGMGSWTAKTALPNTALIANEPVSLTIGSKGYFLSGAYTTMPNVQEFWEFNPAGAGTWTQKASIPGGAIRRGASGFTIDSEGYIGLGLDENSNAHAELWAYDPSSDTWTAKAPIPKSGQGAIELSIAGMGYMGVGVDGIQKEFYKYTPDGGMGSWTRQDDFTGALRYNATGFAINGKGYVVGGQNPIFQDVYKFDPSVPPTVLPIELRSFNASLDAQNRQVSLKWETASEQDNAYFSIERKSSDSDFQEIGQVKSRGNSTKLTVYDFFDKNPQSGISYYRLKQVNRDNTHSYSKIISVTYKKGSKIKIFPTYTEGPIFVESTNNEPLENIAVFTLNGQLRLTSNENEVNISALPTGIYIIQITTVDRVSFLSKVFKK
jgi:N-acetylneuraminic acid mutarotase